MYEYLEEEYKKKSPYRKFLIKYIIIAMALYIEFIILGLFNFNHIISSTLVLLSVIIFIMYVIIFHDLGYGLKQWKLFFKFTKNKKDLKEKMHQKDTDIIRDILNHLKIKRRSDVKLIIEHYRELSIPTKKKYNYFTIISTIIALFISFKDIFVDTEEQLIYSFILLIFILSAFSILYFCFIQIVDLKDIISGNKNVYRNLEELFTEKYINMN